MLIELLLSFGISVVLALIVGHTIPISDRSPLKKKRQVFWSIILSLAFFVLTINTTRAVNARMRLDEIEDLFVRIGPEARRSLTKIYESFTRRYPKVDEESGPVAALAHQAIERLAEELHGEGTLSIPGTAQFRSDIEGFFRATEKGAIACHFGALDFINNPQYLAVNAKLGRACIGLGRFYIYEGPTHTDNGERFEKYSDYLVEVKKIHVDCELPYSCVIAKELLGEMSPRDLLIVDGEYLAEAHLDREGKFDFGSISQDPQVLANARDYIMTLIEIARRRRGEVGIFLARNIQIESCFPNWVPTEKIKRSKEKFTNPGPPPANQVPTWKPNKELPLTWESGTDLCDRQTEKRIMERILPQ